MAERIPLTEVTSNPNFLLLNTCCLKITKKQERKEIRKKKNQKKEKHKEGQKEKKNH